MGYCEGDTLVIAIMGIKLGPHRLIDLFATPDTQDPHVIERYRRRGQATTRGRGSMVNAFS